MALRPIRFTEIDSEESACVNYPSRCGPSSERKDDFLSKSSFAASFKSTKSMLNSGFSRTIQNCQKEEHQNQTALPHWLYRRSKGNRQKSSPSDQTESVSAQINLYPPRFTTKVEDSDTLPKKTMNDKYTDLTFCWLRIFAKRDPELTDSFITKILPMLTDWALVYFPI